MFIYLDIHIMKMESFSPLSSIALYIYHLYHFIYQNDDDGRQRLVEMIILKLLKIYLVWERESY